jgi:hypothetical protein
MPTELPAVTLWLTTRDSWSPKLRYARRYMSRSASESSFWLVPDCGMQAPPLHARLNGATGMLVGPVSVVAAGLAQSTRNLHRLSALDPRFRK